MEWERRTEFDEEGDDERDDGAGAAPLCKDLTCIVGVDVLVVGVSGLAGFVDLVDLYQKLISTSAHASLPSNTHLVLALADELVAVLEEREDEEGADCDLGGKVEPHERAVGGNESAFPADGANQSKKRSDRSNGVHDADYDERDFLGGRERESIISLGVWVKGTNC